MDVFPTAELAIHPGVTLAATYTNGRWSTMVYTWLVENRRRDWVETCSVPDSEWSRALETGIISLIVNQGGHWTWGWKAKTNFLIFVYSSSLPHCGLSCF